MHFLPSLKSCLISMEITFNSTYFSTTTTTPTTIQMVFYNDDFTSQCSTLKTRADEKVDFRSRQPLQLTIRLTLQFRSHSIFSPIVHAFSLCSCSLSLLKNFSFTLTTIFQLFNLFILLLLFNLYYIIIC